MDVMAVLKRHHIRPSKGLAQNFLISEQVMERILQVSDLQPDDVVLEVGPGVGVLTRRMAERVSAVVAVELDRKMQTVLADTLKGTTNVHLVQGDILEIDPVAALRRALGQNDEIAQPYKVVANLPYYITSSALEHLLGASVRPTQLTVMVQREVAERMAAAPGDLSLLGVSVQLYGEVELVAQVPATAFFPPPKVTSAVVRVRVYPEPRVPEADIPRFFRVVRAGFGQKRKQLHNSLTHNLHLPREQIVAALEGVGIDPQRRAQTLSIDEWRRLSEALFL